MALSENQKKRVQIILNAEWANFQNFAVAYSLLIARKKFGMEQLALFNAKKPSIFKTYGDYQKYVANHNKLNNKWLLLKNRYTERQRQLRILNSNGQLKEAFDGYTKNSVELLKKAQGVNGLGFEPLTIVLVCLALAALSNVLANKFFAQEPSVLQDYKELTTLTSEVGKTNPVLAEQILKNYQGGVSEKIKAETESTISAQVGKGLQTAIVVGAVALTGLGVYKYYQSNRRKSRRR